MSAAVELDHISLAYGRTPVLRDVSLRIEPGEFFALLGPSGSGKSTLLRVIAGFATAQEGRVMIGREDMTSVPPWRRNVGMVFQNYALWPHMTVYQNVAFGLEERRVARKQIEARTRAALELVGLADLATRRPGQLSGGQQQRVALARTIAVEPRVLLLDEPLSNLDAKLRVHMRRELRELQRKLGITTIFVTHDQEEALTTADRVAVLDKGVVQQVGTPLELYDAPVNRFVASFVGTINLIPAEVHHESDGAYILVNEEPLIALPADVTAAEGARIEIGFRPHAVRVTPAGAVTDPRCAWMTGAITGREFLGEFVRYHIDVNGVALVADQMHLAGQPTFAIGDAVRAGVAPSHMQLLPGYSE